MPNHIENHLTIEGPISEIEKLVKKAAGPNKEGTTGDHKFTLNAFVPMPSDIFRGDISHEDQVRTQGRNWYDWSINNWGTKWDCYESTYKRLEDPILDQIAAVAAGKSKAKEIYAKVLFTFQTAWSPPDPVIRAVAKEFPKLKIKHEYSDEDSGGQNHGCNTYEGGELAEELTYDGSNPDEDDPIRDLSIRLHGRDRYLPRCEFCGEDLDQTDIKKFGLERRYGCCQSCKDAGYDKENAYPTKEATAK